MQRQKITKLDMKKGELFIYFLCLLTTWQAQSWIATTAPLFLLSL